ncbi:MAG: VOC family protein [Terriglobales bacterium]
MPTFRDWQPVPPDSLLFHHIGVACHPDATTQGAERAKFELLGYRCEGEEWTDERLGMRGQFMTAADSEAPRLELVAPYGSQNPVTLWLERGVKLYHLAFLATDLSAELERMRTNGAKLMLPPTPAVGFGGRKVAFVMLPNRLLVELVESGLQQLP